MSVFTSLENPIHTAASSVIFTGKLSCVLVTVISPVTYGEAGMKAYKIGRWVVLIALVLLLGLIFIKPTRIVDPQPPTLKKDNAEAFQTKLVELEQAHARGESGSEIRVNADEVGAALAASSAQAVPVQTAPEGSVK